MSRWAVPLFITLLASLWVFAHHGSSPFLLQDSDTKVALQAIEARHAPLSWFVTDWPLENHFYRPLATLTLEADLAIHGHNPVGFGTTNGILCALGVLALYWMVYELSESFVLGCLSAWMMAYWLTTPSSIVTDVLLGVAVVTFFAGMVRHGRKLMLYVPVALAIVYLAVELQGTGPAFMQGTLQERVLAWIPGRTATVMGFFALLSCAGYARYERLGSRRDPQRNLTPLDLPATRTSVQYPIKLGQHWLWAVFAFAMAVCAFASYEQAVMLPAALTGIAIILRFRGLRVRWAWQAAFWMLLPAYLMVRHAVIPAGVSSYQAQQMRSGTGGLIQGLTSTLFPAYGNFSDIAVRLESGLLVMLDGGFWWSLLAIAANIGGLWMLRKRWILGFGSLLLSFVTYLPMAWVKYFAHYGYWPAACRSLFVVCLAWTVLEGLVTAVSPQAVQAPQRLEPAPGSLPHG